MNQNENYYESGQIYTVGPFAFSPYLAHHGIKGQKWGERRFQNSDGTLTSAGRERYGYGSLDAKAERRQQREAKRYAKQYEKTYKLAKKQTTDPKANLKVEKKVAKRMSQLKDSDVKRITERLKAENEMLSQIKNRETTLHQIREMKANRTTWFSKYGFELTKKIIDKVAENRGREIQSDSVIKAAEAKAKGDIARVKVEKEQDRKTEEERYKREEKERETTRQDRLDKEKAERDDQKEKARLDREAQREKEGLDREAARQKADLDRTAQTYREQYKADRQADTARFSSKNHNAIMRQHIVEAVAKAQNISKQDAEEYIRKNGTKLMMPDGFILDIYDL